MAWIYVVVAALLFLDGGRSAEGPGRQELVGDYSTRSGADLLENSSAQIKQRHRRQYGMFGPFGYGGPGMGISRDLMAMGMGLQGLGELGYAADMLF
ncbi:unnamed protein product [Soboliphyme baturini]|uniref:Glycine rich superfamily member n=1 Tax=Soboliphyme baturini TaxID=241478 RepID=A0A183J7V1_9BILA|nr:unnamed protein product [Soboliphyme baturini]